LEEMGSNSALNYELDKWLMITLVAAWNRSLYELWWKPRRAKNKQSTVRRTCSARRKKSSKIADRRDLQKDQGNILNSKVIEQKQRIGED
jgi:hypothetical protein